jgi:hypothetical protein
MENPHLPKKPALTDTPESLERGLLLLAILLTVFAFSMPFAFLFHRIGQQIAAQLHAALSVL